MKRIKTLLLAALYLVGVVLLYSVLQMVLTTLLTNYAPAMGYFAALLLSQVVAITSSLGTALILVRWRARQPLAVLGIGFSRGWLRHWGVGSCIGIASVTLVWGMIALMGGYTFSTEPAAQAAVLIPLFLLMMVLVGYSEELLCRGIMAYGVRRVGRGTAALMVGILFALMHGMNPHVSMIGLTNTLLVALALSMMTWLSGNLWMAIGFHTAWNFWMCGVLGVPVSGVDIIGFWRSSAMGDELITGGAYGLEASLVCTVVFVLGLALLYRQLKRRRISLTATDWIA